MRLADALDQVANTLCVLQETVKDAGGGEWDSVWLCLRGCFNFLHPPAAEKGYDSVQREFGNSYMYTARAG